MRHLTRHFTIALFIITILTFNPTTGRCAQGKTLPSKKSPANSSPMAPFIPRSAMPGLPTVGLPPPGNFSLPPLQPMDRLLFGVNVVWGDGGGNRGWDQNNGDRAHRLVHLMKEAGVTVTRIGINWADIEKRPGVFNWKSTDHFVHFVARQGFQIIAVVDVCPDWALNGSPAIRELFQKKGVANLYAVQAPEPRYDADFGQFVRLLVKRYRNTIKRWEVWNEPDGMGMPIVVKNSQGQPVDIRYGGDPNVYTRLLKIFYRNAKLADSGCNVAVGGLQVHSTQFLQAIYGDGGRRYFDAVCLHPYNGDKPIAANWIDDCRQVLVAHGDSNKSFWLTEWGWNTYPAQLDGITEGERVRLIRESFRLMAERPYIAVACYHTLNDWLTDQSNPDSLVGMGLVTLNLIPKPSYELFKREAKGLPLTSNMKVTHLNLCGDLPSVSEDGIKLPVIDAAVDANHIIGAMTPLWRGFAQGGEADNAEFFKPIVGRMKALGVRVIRFDPFTDKNLVKVLPDGALQIDWQKPDAIVKTINRTGAGLMFNFATMPAALASSSDGGMIPASLSLWTKFVREVVQRYVMGQHAHIDYWELSNEPNGTVPLATWLTMYDAFAKTVLSVDPEAKVGGPAAGGIGMDWLKAIAKHCAENHIPLNFLSWHNYNVPSWEYVREVKELRQYLQKYPSLHILPVIGEWNADAGLSPENDGLFAAAHACSVIEKLLNVTPVLSLFFEPKDGWDYLNPGHDFWGRWGMITYNNKVKAVYNAFLAMNKLPDNRLYTITGDMGVHCLAARNKNRIGILLWDDRRNISVRPKPPTPRHDIPVKLKIKNIGFDHSVLVTRYVIDNDYSNSYLNPSSENLTRVARVTESRKTSAIEIPVVLTPYAINLFELTPIHQPAVSIRAESPQFVVYGGSTFPVTITLYNAGKNSLNEVLTLSGVNPFSASADNLIRQRVALKPHQARAILYQLKAPFVSHDVQRFLQVNYGAIASTNLAIKIATTARVSLVTPRFDIEAPNLPPDRAGSVARIQVSLENRGDGVLPVLLQYPGGEDQFSLPPRTIQIRSLPISAPSNRPGNYPVSIKVLIAGVSLTTLKATIGVPALCRYTSTPPHINGDLTDWPNAYPLPLNQAALVHGGPWDGPGDLSGIGYTMWDEHNFYFACSVTDPTFFQPFDADRMWEGDSVQIAIDSRRDGLPGQVGYDSGDTELGFGLVRLQPVIYRFAAPTSLSVGPVKNARLVIRRISNLTIYEAAIPWSQLGMKPPKPGDVIGFTIVINDNNGYGRRTMELTPGVVNQKIPGDFIALRFSQ